MKKILLLVLIVSLIVSCKDSGPRKMGTNKARVEKKNSAAKANETQSKNHEKFVYDVNGVIYAKEITDGCSNGYYFYIELEDGNVFEWETTAAKYARKNVGDPVHFDHLRKSRFSNEAL